SHADDHGALLARFGVPAERGEEGESLIWTRISAWKCVRRERRGESDARNFATRFTEEPGRGRGGRVRAADDSRGSGGAGSPDGAQGESRVGGREVHAEIFFAAPVRNPENALRCRHSQRRKVRRRRGSGRAGV